MAHYDCNIMSPSEACTDYSEHSTKIVPVADYTFPNIPALLGHKNNKPISFPRPIFYVFQFETVCTVNNAINTTMERTQFSILYIYIYVSTTRKCMNNVCEYDSLEIVFFCSFWMCVFVFLFALFFHYHNSGQSSYCFASSYWLCCTALIIFLVPIDCAKFFFNGNWSASILKSTYISNVVYVLFRECGIKRPLHTYSIQLVLTEWK